MSNTEIMFIFVLLHSGSFRRLEKKPPLTLNFYCPDFTATNDKINKIKTNKKSRLNVIEDGI